MNKFICLLILLKISSGLFSQSSGFVFSHITTRDGLSDNRVNCFLKDKQGSLWIGTYNGLNRYNGSHFYAFKRSNKENELLNGNISGLCEDKSGNIWVSTEAGIFCYTPATNTFKNIETPKRGYDKSFINILCDSKGDIWATSLWSLIRYNVAKMKFEEVLVVDNNPVMYASNIIQPNGMLIDNTEKGIWIATGFGLIFYDIATRQQLNASNQPGNNLFTKNSVSALAKSVNGKLWFTDNVTKQIILFDPEKKIILQSINIKHLINDRSAYTLYEDKNNRLWFSSWSGISFVIDYLNGNNIQMIANEPEEKMTIANGNFCAVYEDEDGTLWFATVTGISKCNPEKTLFRVHQLHKKINELINTSISIITEDPTDDTWWLATLDRQIIHYSPKSSRYKIYQLKRALPDRKGQLPGGVFNIAPVGNIIVIATVNGAWQIERGVNVIKPFSFFTNEYRDFKGKYAVASGDSVCFLSDSEEILKINLFSGKTIRFTYTNKTNESEKHGFGFMFTDSKQNIWAHSNLGRLIHTNDNHQISNVNLIKNEDYEYSGFFNTIDIDKDDNIWVVSTGFGLYRYVPSTGNIKYWNETNGLQSPYIQKNKVDNYGNVWLMTHSAITVFAPATESFFHFTIPYGENTVNYYNSMNKLANGNIVGTINNEVIEFFPHRLNLKPATRLPQVSMISVSGKNVSINNQEKLVLEPQENTLHFQFGILTDPGLFPYELEYRLEGAEETWTKSSSLNEAVYNNLSPGNYTFRVLARGKNNAWQTAERKFFIHIKSPFYKTKWFWIMIGVLLIAALFLFYRFRLNKQKQILMLETKAQELEKEKTMVMYESLKQQLNPHFLFNSLTSLSGLIETDQQVAGNFLEQMSGIYRYILKNGDNETVSLKDEIEFVKLYINLQQTRFRNGLQVNINVPDDYLHYKIAPVTLQNLIENAIKHNIIDAGSPLVIEIFVDQDYLVVKNNLQKKSNVETSNKKGLAQFVSLYSYLSEKPVVIEEMEAHFKISIPLI
jgi:ligand-binding sensor domain-containing protein